MGKNVYSSVLNVKETDQSKPIPGRASKMAKNNAGGYVFQVGMFDILDRFLILGSDKPTYYAKADKITENNAANVIACLKKDWKRTIDRIVSVSTSGRAPKNDPALFALAVASTPAFGGNDAARYALSNLHKVARIGTHLFKFVEYLNGMRGWGRAVKTAVGGWYTERTVSSLCYQLAKYQSRNGWSHRDVLRLAHPHAHEPLKGKALGWAVNGGAGEEVADLPYIGAMELAKSADSAVKIANLIQDFGLTREMIPTQWLNDPLVWDALLQSMPMEAMVRNLGKMSSVGIMAPLSDASKVVINRLGDSDYLRESRIHPMKVLLASGVYKSGRGVKGGNQWHVVQPVVDALEGAFYAAFDNVVPTGRNIYVGLDVSGSMGCEFTPGSGVTCAEAAAAMALVVARTEPNYAIYGFSNQMVDLGFTAKTSLHEATGKTRMMTFGSTDCAVAMRHALANRMKVDAFLTITDNETWAGHIHPTQALREYRNYASDSSVKNIVMAMTATDFTIADPKDPYSLDVVGLDSAVPSVITDFIRGEGVSVASDFEE